MGEERTLALTAMAHGGAALGHEKGGRIIFVPLAIPGERVRVALDEERSKKGYAHARLLEVLEASPARVEAPCPHFGVCGGCHFQHIAYEAELDFKRQVVVDQLNRIGGIRDADVRAVWGNPEPYDYRTETALSPAGNGRLGFWSPLRGEVIPIDTCLIIRPALRQLLEDIDLELPGLRKLTLREGDDEALLAAIEVDGVEPPALEADFPISVTIVLPDGTAANLVGDNYILHHVGGRDFRVSAGVFFHPSPPAAQKLAETVVAWAHLQGTEQVVEGYSGAGMLTAALAETGAEIIGVEQNADAVADAALNLADFDNVSLYEGSVEQVWPALDARPPVVVVDPPASGLSKAALAALERLRPRRVVYSSASVATMARDAKGLSKAGYRLVGVQPIDMFPQNYEVQTVSWWKNK